MGTYTISAGTLDVNDDVFAGNSGTGTLTQSGGAVDVNGDLYIGYNSSSTGTYTISGGTLEVNDLSIAQAGAGDFTISDAAATITIGGDFAFGADANFAITDANGATITMTRDVSALEIDANTAAAEVAGLGLLTLQFNGEDSNTTEDRESDFIKTIECAGQDMGDVNLPVVADFDADNFVIDELIVGDDSATDQITLKLVDDNDHVAGEDEAVYVKKLSFQDWGMFPDLNGKPLYYLRYEGEETDNPRMYFAGDASRDGLVGIVDLNMILIDWGKTTGLTYPESDVNKDGYVDIIDISAVLRDFGKGIDTD